MKKWGNKYETKYIKLLNGEKYGCSHAMLQK